MSALHNVAVTLGAVRRIVDNGQRARRRLRKRGRPECHAPVRQHLVAAHRDAGPVRWLGRQLRGRGLRARGGSRRRRRRMRLRRARHARSARPRPVRAVQAARRPGASHACPRVKVRRLCRPQCSIIYTTFTDTNKSMNWYN